MLSRAEIYLSINLFIVVTMDKKIIYRLKKLLCNYGEI